MMEFYRFFPLEIFGIADSNLLYRLLADEVKALFKQTKKKVFRKIKINVFIDEAETIDIQKFPV